jgi:Ca-activated chloride channel family protein
MDVSGSMRAADVQPTRLVAAQEAAKSFVADLPRNVKIAVVSFAGTAAVVQAPTLSRDDVNAAIDRFQLQRGTAIGSGIVLSLATLFPEAGIDLSQITGARPMPPGPNDKPKPDFTPVAPGSYSSAAIILLTDGQRTTGPIRSRRRRWRPTAACASTPSASAPRKARRSASRAGRCASGSTRRR